jgi:hypothetical protein
VNLIFLEVRMEAYDHQQALDELCAKLAEAEEDIANGDEGEDFFTTAANMRELLRRAREMDDGTAKIVIRDVIEDDDE